MSGPAGEVPAAQPVAGLEAAGVPTVRPVPPATVGRLPGYLRALTELSVLGVRTTSSERLAALAGVGSAQLRRDLSWLGSHGVRGVGYDVRRLRGRVADALGVESDLAVVIVGIGRLGHALADYLRAEGGGFRVAALVDTDPGVVGSAVAGLAVEDDKDLEDVVRREGAVLAVLATPVQAAQRVCDRLVSAGVRGILAFTPARLAVPDGVTVRAADVAAELQILAFHTRGTPA
ncbi:redox-sensing transcriptional repressor Rex [Isoptericola sp. b441]|uniref:Redox-sensing transcriptional repressor Rex n=1 Tax=Actinotalea lenta TaxID=3064654 RepID=A0ABT9D6M4_9CELL|nr:redox-sensing transcriptional repressor Rex [Isoptericola sp. b441]MDO8106488.1 redox-sensing transcriptional repressor Rex [Isoptericola sp. b441]